VEFFFCFFAGESFLDVFSLSWGEDSLFHVSAVIVESVMKVTLLLQ
jgi:hypothetical protein